jgi:hypothetical protein
MRQDIGSTLRYWRIGRGIHREVQGSERAAYGEQIVVTLSRQLSWSTLHILAPCPSARGPDSGIQRCKLPLIPTIRPCAGASDSRVPVAAERACLCLSPVRIP